MDGYLNFKEIVDLRVPSEYTNNRNIIAIGTTIKSNVWLWNLN